MTTLLGMLRNRLWRNNLTAGVAGVLLGGLVGSVLILWAGRPIPVVVVQEHQLNENIYQNGHLDLYVEVDRSRDCPSETSRWLWTWVDHNGQRLRHYYPLVNSSTSLSELGHHRFVLSIPLPTDIWPGNWYYWSKTIEHCPLMPFVGQSTIHQSADIPIHISNETP